MPTNDSSAETVKDATKGQEEFKEEKKEFDKQLQNQPGSFFEYPYLPPPPHAEQPPPSASRLSRIAHWMALSPGTTSPRPFGVRQTRPSIDTPRPSNHSTPKRQLSPVPLSQSIKSLRRDNDSYGHH